VLPLNQETVMVDVLVEPLNEPNCRPHDSLLTFHIKRISKGREIFDLNHAVSME
jgi:hypothetical protein